MGYRGEIKFKFKPTLTYITSHSEFGVDIPGKIDKKVFQPDNIIYNVGDKIGQLIIMPYPNISFIEVDELTETERGDGGFGHTGI